MRSKLFFVSLFLFLALSLSGFQDSEPPHYPLASKIGTLRFEHGLALSAQNSLPFWIIAHNNARLPGSASNAIYSNIIFSRKSGKSGIDYFYGLEVAPVLEKKYRVYFIQGYGGIKLGAVNIRAGAKEETFGLNDSTLSMGSLVYGNNARPVPKIVIYTDAWVQSPLFPNIFSFKAYLAHGWFEKERYQSGTLLHQKYLYVRTQLLHKKLQVFLGLHHNAQWGGANLSEESQQPTGLKNYARIFLGLSGGEDALRPERNNALGNHLGTYDIRGSYRFKKFTLSNYWQFLWEDKSGLTPFNWRDGMLGISFTLHNKQKVVHSVNLEIIRTNDQDAEKVSKSGSPFLEPDNFFNNNVYRSGWTYKGRVVGSPVFLLINPEAASNSKVKNMVNGFQLGVGGRFKTIDYRLRYQWFRNQGTRFEQFDPALKLNAIVADIRLPYRKGTVAILATYDWGSYLSKNFGIRLAYRHHINF